MNTAEEIKIVLPKRGQGYWLSSEGKLEKEGLLKTFNELSDTAKEEYNKNMSITNLDVVLEKKSVTTDENTSLEEVPNNEESVPLSKVEKMIADAIRKLPKPEMPSATPQREYAPSNYNGVDIEDGIPEFDNWIMKDRQYVLADGSKPASYSIASRHTEQISLNYTNRKTQQVNTLRYATNQPSFFVEKQSKEMGSVLVKDIVFKDGMLKVPASNITLQKFLAIHPHLGIVFKEYDPTEEAKGKVSKEKLILKAGNLALEVGELTNRAIASMVITGYTDSTLYEIVEQQILDYTKADPQKYIEYANNPDIKIKGIAKSAVSSGDIVYSHFRFTDRKGQILVEVGRNEDEYDALVAYLKSSLGRNTYEYLKESRQ